MTAIHTAGYGSEFDEFLYASIAEEHNGTLLSVLSALARRNLDPWDEAARLAGLPRAAARQWLTTLIAAIPDGPLPRGDPGLLVERLIALLPRRAPPAPPPRPPCLIRRCLMLRLPNRRHLATNGVTVVLMQLSAFHRRHMFHRSASGDALA